MNGAPKQEHAAPSPASNEAAPPTASTAPLPPLVAGNTLPSANSTPSQPATKTPRTKPEVQPNNVRKLRQAAMMSKAELARRAGVSPLTINRVEAGWPCRMDTKRKILEALGLNPAAREEVFGPDSEAG
ncbi:MAG TPA: helix-turn-helix domain-containing protein [Nannocystaceae bacterium]|nr:helix-turn-helix domain-containing protein [Nannocystaceae bacterium]